MNLSNHFVCLLVDIACIVQFLIQEVNLFYIKAILWYPPNHMLNAYRELLYALAGACAFREIYDYLSSK